MDQPKIGKFICSSRKEKGLTQSQLARRMGVSTNAVSKWERGMNLPDASIMPELCEVLGISLNELFAGERLDDHSLAEQADHTILSLLKFHTARLHEAKVLTAILLTALIVTLLFIGRGILIQKGYWPDAQLKYTQVYITGNGNVKGNVDVDQFAKISIDYDIGANKYGQAVFKDPEAAWSRMKTDNADGIRAIQDEFHLLPLSVLNFRLYGTYGWQLTDGTEAEKEQARFITRFMDVYENSFQS